MVSNMEEGKPRLANRPLKGEGRRRIPLEFLLEIPIFGDKTGESSFSPLSIFSPLSFRLLCSSGWGSPHVTVCAPPLRELRHSDRRDPVLRALPHALLLAAVPEDALDRGRT